MMADKSMVPPMPKGAFDEETCIKCGKKELLHPDGGLKKEWSEKEKKFFWVGYVCADCMKKEGW